MKKQIEQLVELAKDYVTFGVEANLPMSHNVVRGKQNKEFDWVQEGEKINVYLSNGGETWSITFGGITINGYADQIELPFDFTDELLENTFIDCQKYLMEYLFPIVAKVKIEVLRAKHNEIKSLERKIRTLKGLSAA